MSKNQDNKTHTLKALSGKKKKIYYYRKWLRDILSHQPDEEQCAENMIVFLFVFALGAFVFQTL